MAFVDPVAAFSCYADLVYCLSQADFPSVQELSENIFCSESAAACREDDRSAYGGHFFCISKAIILEHADDRAYNI